MCGIVGAISSGLLCKDIVDITNSVKILYHRGPDSNGVVYNCLSWCDYILGMTRLKIVDQTNLLIPYRFHDYHRNSNIILSFNGEIYNWKDIRKELGDDIYWETNCDAEVIARAWLKWGVDCLNHFNGMFAFCLVDVKSNKIFLARDRAGEKPLYYSVSNDAFYFASEIKALPIELKESFCSELECLEFDCLSRTPFENVFSLDPGSYLLMENVNEFLYPKPVSWWTLPREYDLLTDYNEAVEELCSLITDSVKIRSNSEVPIALLLSGGLDSAIIHAVAKVNDLYCCDFSSDGIDNITAAKIASNGIGDLRCVTFNNEELLEYLYKIVYHLDTPATWTSIAQWFLFKKISEDKKVVVLSGEGADELFGGYARYRILWYLDKMCSDLLLDKYHPTIDYLIGKDFEIIAKLLDRSKGSFVGTARSIVNRYSTSESLVVNAMYVEFYTTMQVLLRMADRMAAAFSLENRSPFLDYRIMEFSSRVPISWKIRSDTSKSILRDVAKIFGVPDDIIFEKSKKGLFIPWSKWNSSSSIDGRGVWERGDFAKMMRDRWKGVFFNND